MVELLGGWDLEAVDPDALRVHAAHHVADGAVLAGRVERLQYHQHPPFVLSGESGLVLRQQPHPGLEQGDALLLLFHPRLERGSKSLPRVHLRPGLDAERLDEVGRPPLLMSPTRHRLLHAKSPRAIRPALTRHSTAAETQNSRIAVPAFTPRIVIRRGSPALVLRSLPPTGPLPCCWSRGPYASERTCASVPGRDRRPFTQVNPRTPAAPSALDDTVLASWRSGS